MVGTFYASPTPDTDAYVKLGSNVTTDSIVCIVEAMKLFNEIEAEINGEIVEILAKNGQLVEYGQPLFLVKPE
jgi:acetyl-CoA carboxylase biotin carboxyl carrier protein